MNQNYLIDHWSYSSMKEFLRNRFMFKRRYILKIYDFTKSPAMIVGSASHKALEVLLKGGTETEATEAGLLVINRVQEEEVNWGKTGSREKVIKTFTQAFQDYISEVDISKLRGQALGIEQVITAEIECEGIKMALPAKAVLDLVYRNDDGKLTILDHKFVSTYTDGETENGGLMLQAMFYYHTVKAEYGEAPVEMIFNECKVSKNKNGDGQVQPYVIKYEEHPEYFKLFTRIYDSCTVELSKPDIQFLPNLSDLMDAKDTLKHYSAGITGTERPTAIQHKTKDVQIVEKNFVPSGTDIVDNAHLTNEEKIRMKLLEFGIAVEMQQTYQGLNIIKYTLKPSRGTKMSQFEKFGKDIAIALQCKYVRIEAPIMGTNLIGIEIPNPERKFLSLKDAQYETAEALQGTLRIPIGVNVLGEVVVRDLSEMPHLLIAGATGSGKSVMINVAIQSLVAQNNPMQMKLVLIDPKRVELARYKTNPNLLVKPIYETEEATKALQWLIEEMEDRYNKLESVGAVNLAEYNRMNPPLPKIVIVVDEFADLMLQSKDNLAETAIVRIAQKARAVGIHLILGTQRPSVDVVTGVIKANLPSRIAFATAQRVDSQVILDQSGAEQLSGKGDCLFLDPSSRELLRLQALFV